MNRISFLNRGYAFKGLLAVYMQGLVVVVILVCKISVGRHKCRKVDRWTNE